MLTPPHDPDDQAKEIAIKAENELWRAAVMAEQESLDAEIAGQKVSFKTSNLNTVATVGCLCLSIVIAVVLYGHTVDTKEQAKENILTQKEVIVAMKDQTQAAREQNCLISLPQERREQNSEICKRITR